MSKKRRLILGLALLPFALGCALIATLANGSRFAKPARSAAAATSEARLTDTAEEASPGIADLHASMIPKPANTPAASRIETPRTQELPIGSHTQYPSPVQLVASSSTGDVSGGSATVADIGAPTQQFDATFGHRRRTLASVGLGNRHAGGGSGGSGGSGAAPSSTSGSNENATPSIQSNEEDDALLPSEDLRRESIDESSGAGAGEDSNRPATEHEQTQPKDDESNGEGEEPKLQEPKLEEPKDEGSSEDGFVGQFPIGTDPVYTDPIYIPPQQATPRVVQVPEPATLGLLGLGLLGCAAARRRRAS